MGYIGEIDTKMGYIGEIDTKKVRKRAKSPYLMLRFVKPRATILLPRSEKVFSS
jgi:hypothetical protein